MPESGATRERRPYLRLTPSTERLTPATVTAGLERLHGLALSQRASGGLVGLTDTGEPATLEWLVATQGQGADAPVAIYVGLAPPPASDRDPVALRDRLKPIVRDLLPDSYTVEPVRWHPRAVVDPRDGSAGDAAPGPEREPVSKADAGADAGTGTGAERRADDDGDSDGDGDGDTVTPPPLSAALELRGAPTRHDDWQTRLTPLGAHYAERSATTDRSGTTVRLPMGTIVAALADAPGPAVVQTCCRPLPDWSDTQAARRQRLDAQQDTLRDRLVTALAGPPPDDVDLPPADRDRREELDRKDARHSFAVTVRAVVGPARDGTDGRAGTAESAPDGTQDDRRSPAAVVDGLQDALRGVGQTTYQVRAETWTAPDATTAGTDGRPSTTADGPPAPIRDCYRALCARRVTDPRGGLRDRLPGTGDPSAVVADAAETASLCCVDGGALPPAARRALATTPPAKTETPRPPDTQLAPYRADEQTGAETPGGAEPDDDDDASGATTAGETGKTESESLFGTAATATPDAAREGEGEDDGDGDGGDRAEAGLDGAGDGAGAGAGAGAASDGATNAAGTTAPEGTATGGTSDDGERIGTGAIPGADTAAAVTPRERARDATTAHGMTLGRPRTQDGTATAPIALPPALQSLHVAWFGRTGAGKSTALITAILDNHAATDGADVLIDPKGDGMATDYLRAHYARYGSLENVLYFDCAETVPAIPFFDIRDELAAGVPRATAVADTVDHYVEILRGIMGPDRFDQAVRAPDIIRYLVRALFDPVHGQDAFGHATLHRTARLMHDRASAPSVSDDDLERMLEGVVANRAKTFDQLMQGVANRIEKIPTDPRLARLFDHVPDSRGGRHPSGASTAAGAGTDTDAAGDGPYGAAGGPDGEGEGAAGDPVFDLADYLNEDVVIVIDTGGLRDAAQRVLTLVVLSNLWTALRRRARRAAQDGPGRGAASGASASAGTAASRGDPTDDSAGTGTGNGPETGTGNGPATGTETGAGDSASPAERDQPLVNCYVEEAASIANAELLGTLLAQGRGFDCSLTLAMQFPGQLRESAPAAYDEVLNNVGTVLTGPLPLDERLARRLATGETGTDEVAARLRALDRGTWLAALPAPFDQPAPQPFTLRSCAPPAGHPAHEPGLDAVTRARIDDAIDAARERTRRMAGLAVGDAAGTGADTATADDDETTTPLARAAGPARVDTALPYTERLPPTVEYDPAMHALRCTACDSRAAPTAAGLERAIACCDSLAAVDPDDVPICDLHLKLTPAEIADHDWSRRQLLFLQAVYNAQQQRYEPPAYDLCTDSMLRLQEYVGIDRDAVDALCDAGLLRHDGDHPHRLFSVTPAGRDVLGEDHRAGVDYGHGHGDLTESSLHVLAVEVARRYLETAYVADPDSPVTEAIPYYERDDGRRLDLVGRDATGAVRVTVEAERVHHDIGRAVPADYDTMAACEPDEALWVVPTQAAGHEVLAALNDPLEGSPRVDKTYADSTPPQQFRIDTPGLTAVYPVGWLHNQIERDANGDGAAAESRR